MLHMDVEAQQPLAAASHIRMKHLATMPQPVSWFLLALALVLVPDGSPGPAVAVSGVAPASPVVAYPQPGCRRKCGEVDIPYPFGIDDDNCSWPGMLTVACNHSFSPPRPYLSNIEIINISVETGEMQVYTEASSICYNSTGINTTEVSFDFTDTPMLISTRRNVFTAIGCNTLALLLNGREDLSFYTGCISSCTSVDEAAPDGERCTGLGCCQTPVPGNLSTIKVDWNNGSDDNSAWSYSPCSYGFVSAENWYHYKRQDLRSDDGKGSFISGVGDRNMSMVLDWAITQNGSCLSSTEDGKKPTAPACVSTNSQCVNATQGPGHGYLCNCSEGYQGNPYIPDGCRDINECRTMNRPCGPYTSCKNTEGDHICKCNFNRKGDGKSEEGCNKYKVSPYVIAAIAIVVASILACFATVLLQKRNKRKLFNKNGGKILEMSGITIYSEIYLKNITKGRKRLGGGNFGEVYEGRIDGAQAQQVAVKYSAASSMVRRWPLTILQVVQQQEQDDDGGFVSEIIFQFRIKHTNVVKLIGCYLETDVPILVFEFISNGSLEDKLHGDDKRYTLSLVKRLDIAIGSAEALSHIHSHGDHVHGDIKPANILLDDDLNPKVSDFGSSKLLSFRSYFKGIVPADLRYIDPVYTKTNHFTVKSDVYSFGVVLLELITRKTAMYDGNRSLPIDFVKCFKDEGSGRKMYDSEVCSGDDAQSQCNMQCLDMIGLLAVRCLKEDVEERPTMAEVVEDLKQVKAIACGGSSSSEAS